MGRQDPEKLRQKAACIYGIEEFLCSISFQGPSCSWTRTTVFDIGGVVGAVLGIVLGEKASVLYPIGQIWLNLLFVLLVPLMMTQLFDAGCTLINSCGDTVASMLVTRVLYGKDWYKKGLNEREHAEI